MGEFTSLLFYLLSFILSAFLLTVGNIGPKRSGALICIALLIPIAIAAFRYGVGTDYWVYVRIFNETRDIPWQYVFMRIRGIEYGHVILTKLISVIGDSRLYFGALSALTIFPIYFALSKHYKKLSIGLCFFMYLMLNFATSFNAVRQFAAVSVVFWGFNFIFERNLLKYFITIIFATVTLHSSAIIALPIYFLWDREKSTVPKIPAILGITVILIFIFAFQSFFEQMTQISDNFDRYSAYAATDTQGKNRDLILKAVIFITILLHCKRLVNMDPRNQLFILFLFIAILFGITGFKTPFVKRVGIYFDIVGIVLLPQISYLYDHGNKPLIRFFMVLYGIGLFALMFYIIGHSDVIPYNVSFE